MISCYKLHKFFIYVILIIIILIIYQLSGCGGGSGTGSSSASKVNNGVDPNSAKFYVNVTLKFPEKKDIKEIKEKSATDLDYFEVKLFKKDTEAQIGDTQKVERPNTGNQATITFWDVPQGCIKLIVKGYSNNKVLFAEGESDIDVSLASATGNNSGGSGSGSLSNENTGNSVNNEPVVLPTGTVVNGPSAPKISEVKPKAISIGDTVTITGSGFGGSRGKVSSKASDDNKSCIYFGGVKATDYVFWSDTYIVCRVPKNASMANLNVCVSVGGGTGGATVSAGSSATAVSVQPAPSSVGGGGGGGTPGPTVVDGMVEVPAITAGNYATVNLRLGRGGGAYATRTQIQQISSFYVGIYEVKCTDFCTFLNASDTAGSNNPIEDINGVTTWWNSTGDATYNGIIYSAGSPVGSRYTVRSGFENRPAVYISWYGAVAYCNWLTLQKGMTLADQCYGGFAADGLTRWGANGANYHPERKGYRLPTEAEWEYASRFNTASVLSTMDYYWLENYNNPAGSPFNIATYCWHNVNSGGNHHDVGGKTANGLGLYDIAGNVWEWCGDWYNGTFPLDDFAGGSAVINPKGTKTVSAARVMRGGGWNSSTADYCSSYYCNNASPDARNNNLGFRIARTK